MDDNQKLVQNPKKGSKSKNGSKFKNGGNKKMELILKMDLIPKKFETSSKLVGTPCIMVVLPLYTTVLLTRK